MKRVKKSIILSFGRIKDGLSVPPNPIKWEEIGRESIPASWLGGHEPYNCRLIETRDGIACVDVSQRKAFEFKKDDMIAVIKDVNEPAKIGLVDSIDNEHKLITILLPPVEDSNSDPMGRTYNLALSGDDNDHIIGLAIFLLIRGWD